MLIVVAKAKLRAKTKAHIFLSELKILTASRTPIGTILTSYLLATDVQAGSPRLFLFPLYKAELEAL